MALGWEANSRAGCFIDDRHYPAGMLATKQLNNVLPHLSEDQYKAAAHLMIGRARANLSIEARSRLGHTSDGRVTAGDKEGEEKYAKLAAEHLCQAIALDIRFTEPANKILAEIDGSCPSRQ